MAFDLKERGLYAVLPQASIFLLYREENSTNNVISFLQLPDLIEIDFEDVNEFNIFLNYRTLDFVEQLPREVYDVCIGNAKK